MWNADSAREYFKWGGQLRPGVSRAMSTVEAINKIHFNSVSQAEPDVNGRRLGLFANYNLLDHASKFDGFYSLYLREMDDIVSHEIYGHKRDGRVEEFSWGCVRQSSRQCRGLGGKGFVFAHGHGRAETGIRK